MIKIPKRYENVKWEDTPKEIADHLHNYKKGEGENKGLYIYGGVGSGKTHLAYSIAKRANEKDIAMVIKNVPELLREFRLDLKREGVQKTFIEDKIMNYSGLLVLDDIGSEKMSDWVEETFYLIINKRYNEMLPTVFTSNLKLSELAERIGDRLASRIAGSCVSYELKGEDKRITK